MKGRSSNLRNNRCAAIRQADRERGRSIQSSCEETEKLWKPGLGIFLEKNQTFLSLWEQLVEKRDGGNLCP